MNWITTVGLVLFGLTTALAQDSKAKKFSCEGRTSGYYADVGSGCQVYHMCDGLGRQFSYTCPNATLFQQRMLICDHWYMVNCSKSESDYDANLLIGQRGKPFVDDADLHPYHRTPRPDLLSHPSASEYNIIYQKGTNTQNNIIGVSTDPNTDAPKYSLPSHWSTGYTRGSTTARSVNKIVYNRKSNKSPKAIETNTRDLSNQRIENDDTKYRQKAVEPNTLNLENGNTKYRQTNYRLIRTTTEVPVNFKSNFKATTPVYPLTVDVVSERGDEAGLVPPKNYESSTQVALERLQTVNFESNFKATTPVYPLTVEATSENGDEVGLLPPGGDKSNKLVQAEVTYQQVNYKSNFKATTPVYPLTVDATSENPSEVGLVAPSEGKDTVKDSNIPELNLSFEPPKYDDGYKKENRTFEVQKPSKFYQAPKFEPDYTVQDTKTTKDGRILNNNNKVVKVFQTINPEEWNEIKQKLSIPDYEFPLDAATRPSYESNFDSFQANTKSYKK